MATERKESPFEKMMDPESSDSGGHVTAASQMGAEMNDSESVSILSFTYLCKLEHFHSMSGQIDISWFSLHLVDSQCHTRR